jgi:light-regulated signal transduction histidine kinase (bacteriophytochrome)
MGRLIDDMLALSRVTRSDMQRELVDLGKMANEIFSELQKNEPERKVEWRIGNELIAWGDMRLLRMALFNLLGNAWKYTAHQPQPRIEFDVQRQVDGTMEFFVKDNGAGFDMAYADNLFGAFQRLHTTAEFPGTGVGLAIVQRVIHRHGGQVRGIGTPNQGATFYFTLPA